MINFVIGGRHSGKTEAMFKWMLEAPESEHRVCVSHSHERSMRMLRESRERGYNLESWQFVGCEGITQRSWSGVLMGRGGHIVLGLDDVDLQLRLMLGWPVEFVTGTGDIL